MYYRYDLARLRQSGDIDVWIPIPAVEVVKLVVKTCKSVPVDEFDLKHIQYPIYSNTAVELHWVPYMISNPFRNCHFLNFCNHSLNSELSNIVHVGKYSICASTTNFNRVYILLHIFCHYLYEGVNTKQIMDYYFILTTSKQENKEEIQELLMLTRKLGLTKFAQALMWVMKEVFYLDSKSMPWTPDANDGVMLLKDIIADNKHVLTNKNWLL